MIKHQIVAEIVVSTVAEINYTFLRWQQVGCRMFLFHGGIG